MTLCEMCGRTGDLVSAAIEGVPLTVCSVCAKYGVVNRSSSSSSSWSNSSSGMNRKGLPVRSLPPPQMKPEFQVVDSYAQLLRTVREKKKMTQKDFALFLQEKESLMAKWESGGAKPDLETAKKLQKLLGVTLIALDDTVVDMGKVERGKSTEFTLGDFVKVKKGKII